MNRKEELLSKIRDLSKKIGSVKVYFNEYKTGGNDGMGLECYHVSRVVKRPNV